ncbi:Alkaline shock-like protein [Gaiella occulta]|uniref:Alkaline shock-like protein n=1 Tax=Gaiella occulta TaxID=1002870 RepID=A0A7M2YYF7_9ACTN|nr:hypothetical protein [Gaiella occulta]RDI75059.1 Alkaline shock-like protein [Gaiella occulta]
MRRDRLVVAGTLGKIEVTSAALASVVVHAAESVAGVHVRRPRRRVDVSVDDGSAHVEVALTGPLDGVLPEVGERVQHAVAAALSASTGLAVSVDVSFEELA